jgi:thioredoxin family protein
MAQQKIPLDATRFATGMTWKDYVAQMGDTRARTEDNYAKSTLTEDERKFFNGVAQARYCLMMAENWCGDVHRNSPLIAHICEAMPNCELRVFFRDKNLDLTDCFLNNGYRSIPIVAFFDKDWNEVGRWIERAGAATAKVSQIRAKTVDVAPPDKASQDAAMGEYRKLVQAEYDAPGASLWRAAAKEVRLILETRLGLIPADQRG